MSNVDVNCQKKKMLTKANQIAWALSQYVLSTMAQVNMFPLSYILNLPVNFRFLQASNIFDFKLSSALIIYSSVTTYCSFQANNITT